MSDPKLAPLIATTSGGGTNRSRNASQPLLLQPWPAFLSGVAVLVGTLWFFYCEIVYLEVCSFLRSEEGMRKEHASFSFSFSFVL